MAAAAVRQPTDTGPAGSGCSGGKVEIGVRVCAWHVAWRGVSGNAVCLCADACVCSHCCDQFLSSVPSKRIRFKMYDLSFALSMLAITVAYDSTALSVLQDRPSGGLSEHAVQNC